MSEAHQGKTDKCSTTEETCKENKLKKAHGKVILYWYIYLCKNIAGIPNQNALLSFKLSTWQSSALKCTLKIRYMYDK